VAISAYQHARKNQILLVRYKAVNRFNGLALANVSVGFCPACSSEGLVSVKIMAAVWELALPANEKLIALAFADHANDDGVCYPSLRRIAWKCNVSRDTAKRIAAKLRNAGILVVLQESGGAGHPPRYRVVPEKGCKLTPLIQAEGVQSLPKRGATTPQKGCTAMPPESKPVTEYSEPPIQHDTPRTETVRGAARESKSSGETKSRTERHFPYQELLLRFAQTFRYSITEADGRLGWILHRALQRKEFHNSSGPRIHNEWAYVVKANANLDLQRYSEPGGVGPLIEKHSFAEMTGIKLRQCPQCLDSVIAGMDCSCNPAEHHKPETRKKRRRVKCIRCGKSKLQHNYGHAGHAFATATF
jgi:Helix-turn-helix domain